MEALLIITGTMGAGKSAVLAEASDLLAQRFLVRRGRPTCKPKMCVLLSQVS